MSSSLKSLCNVPMTLNWANVDVERHQRHISNWCVKARELVYRSRRLASSHTFPSNFGTRSSIRNHSALPYIFNFVKTVMMRVLASLVEVFFFQGSAVYCTVCDGTATKILLSVYYCVPVRRLLYLLWYTVNGEEGSMGGSARRSKGENSNSQSVCHRRWFRCNRIGERSIPLSTAFIRTRHPLTCFGRAVLGSSSRIHWGQRDSAGKVCVCGANVPSGKRGFGTTSRRASGGRLLDPAGIDLISHPIDLLLGGLLIRTLDSRIRWTECSDD